MAVDLTGTFNVKGTRPGGAWPPPWLRPARHLGRERRTCGAAGRGAVGAAGFQFFRIPGFHPPRPAPAAGRRPGHGQLQQLET